MRKLCRCTHAAHERHCLARNGWTIEKSRPFKERDLTVSFPGTLSGVYGDTKRKIDRQPVRGTTSSSSDPMPTPHRKNRSRAKDTTPPVVAGHVRKAFPVGNGWTMEVISKDDDMDFVPSGTDSNPGSAPGSEGVSEDIFAQITQLASEGKDAKSIAEALEIGGNSSGGLSKDDPVYAEVMTAIRKAVKGLGKSGGNVAGAMSLDSGIQKQDEDRAIPWVDDPDTGLPTEEATEAFEERIEDQRPECPDCGKKHELIDEEGLKSALETAEEAVEEQTEKGLENWFRDEYQKVRGTFVQKSGCDYCRYGLLHTEETCANLR